MKLILNKVTVLALLTALLFASCKRELTDGIDTIINTNIYVAPTVISFVNANVASQVQPKDFTVTITGKDSAKVVMQAGGTNFKVVGGMLQLALLGTAIPTATSPITFNVNVAIDSFAPTSQTIVITDTLPAVKIVKMVDYYNPVQGVAPIIVSNALTGGTMSTVQKITTPASNGLTEATTITIPAGTVMQDAKGNTINAASLKTSLMYFSPLSSSSLAAFPGGLSPTDITGPGGAAIPNGTTFITAGLVSIKMNAGGTEVKKFSTPINVNMDINAAFVNPTTGKPIKAGDIVPIWSRDEVTGKWKYESDATVTVTNGKPSLSFPASHLSDWNCDFAYHQINTYGICNSPLSVKINTTDGSTVPSGKYDVILCSVGYNSWYYYNSSYGYGYYNDWSTTNGNGIFSLVANGTPLYNGATYSAYGFAKAPSAVVKVFDWSTGKELATSSTFTPCGTGTITLNVTRPTPPKQFTVNLVAYGKCSNKNALSYFNGWLYFYKTGDSYGQWVYAYNGKASFQLEDGANYFIYGVDYTTYRYAYGYGIVSSSTVGSFTANGLTCVGSYNAATSVYNLTVTQNVYCN